MRGTPKMLCIFWGPRLAPYEWEAAPFYVGDRVEALALLVTLWKALWFLVRH
jgi:hypothetical protein